MRRAFAEAGIQVPFFRTVESPDELENCELAFPLIVKPIDRSGSRAITKVWDQDQLKMAVCSAMEQSFEKKAIVESYIEGKEYSMESISCQGCLLYTSDAADEG